LGLGWEIHLNGSLDLCLPKVFKHTSLSNKIYIFEAKLQHESLSRTMYRTNGSTGLSGTALAGVGAAGPQGGGGGGGGESVGEGEGHAGATRERAGCGRRRGRRRGKRRKRKWHGRCERRKGTWEVHVTVRRDRGSK
jgi:hypothetical protein